MTAQKKPRLAVWKFSSCDGCQLSLLDCEDELLAVADLVDIAYFPEATRSEDRGRYAISVVEGSIATQHDLVRIQDIRRRSDFILTIGACATSGGIQALRNFAKVEEYAALVYPRPDYLDTLATSTGIADHVKVDFELRGCPVNKHQLLDVLTALATGRRPNTPPHSVCTTCKLKGVACVVVTQGKPCLGPVTHDGCGALCPSYNRACFGCFGPKETPNAAALSAQLLALGNDPKALAHAYRSFVPTAPAFREESDRHGR
ncbi:MAG: oxidoreductase [Geminicoccaceae bacterium]